MSLREILIWPHPTLDRPSDAVTEITESIRSLAEDLVETCLRVEGLGLAAVQVGEPVAMFVLDRSRLDMGEGFEIFVNPKITDRSLESSLLGEGCLSIPGSDESVWRSDKIQIAYTNLEGDPLVLDAEGVLSQVLQHEMDHLEGQVIARRLPAFRRSTLRKKMEILTRKMKKLGVTYLDVVEGRRPS